eukprot:c9498_g1_i2.p1 GENE.c9498_g1_i2~~c9498_g1_i2.p1  ORF type:complete len:427 (-),score=203.63 c9498_g1_i2:26-1306(-)
MFRRATTNSLILTQNKVGATFITRSVGIWKCNPHRIIPQHISPISTIRMFSSDAKVLAIKVPVMGESIKDGKILALTKKVGDYVAPGEEIASIETDKITHSLTSEIGGIVTHVHKKQDDVVLIGEVVIEIDTSAAAPAGTAAPKEAAKPATPAPATPTTQAPSAPQKVAPAAPAAPKPATQAPAPIFQAVPGTRNTRRVPMSKMRQRIAERLKMSQNTAAMLTTFNEIDMTNAINLRKDLQDAFVKQHNVKLGFMSLFVKAAVTALQYQPAANAFIDGTDIVYNDFIDVSVAVSTPTGLVVPVLRNCEGKSIADIEKEIAAYSEKARVGALTLPEMTGGTFTISNGGVFGSLFGTPIINPPQSAILGMHAIKPRPVAVGDKVEVRQMMYVALTYDHRLIDGREAVLCLKSIKESVEDPRKLLLGLY